MEIGIGSDLQYFISSCSIVLAAAVLTLVLALVLALVLVIVLVLALALVLVLLCCLAEIVRTWRGSVGGEKVAARSDVTAAQ